MDTEILNIDHHIKRLVLSALNKFKDEPKLISYSKAGNILGVSGRTVYRYTQDYNIEYNDKNKSYEFMQQRQRTFFR